MAPSDTSAARSATTSVVSHWSRIAAARSSRGRARSSANCMEGRFGAVPRDRALQTLPKGRLRDPAQALAGAARVEGAARLPVRHRGVPDDLAFEAGHVGNGLGEL